MSLLISEETKQLLDAELAAGHYESLDDLLQTALGALRECLDIEELQRVRAAVQVGIDQADRGECVDFDIERFREKAYKMLEQSKK